MRELDADFARKHYFDLEERLGAAVYNATASFMQRGPVIAFVLEGEDAVTTVRKIVGSTYPNEAQPGSIRGDFAPICMSAVGRHGTNSSCSTEPSPSATRTATDSEPLRSSPSI